MVLIGGGQWPRLDEIEKNRGLVSYVYPLTIEFNLVDCRDKCPTLKKEYGYQHYIRVIRAIPYGSETDTSSIVIRGISLIQLNKYVA